MSQVASVSVEVSVAHDYKGADVSAGGTTQDKDKEFSQLIERQMQADERGKNNAEKTSGQVDSSRQSQNTASKNNAEDKAVDGSQDNTRADKSAKTTSSDIEDNESQDHVKNADNTDNTVNSEETTSTQSDKKAAEQSTKESTNTETNDFIDMLAASNKLLAENTNHNTKASAKSDAIAAEENIDKNTKNPDLKQRSPGQVQADVDAKSSALSEDELLAQTKTKDIAKNEEKQVLINNGDTTHSPDKDEVIGKSSTEKGQVKNEIDALKNASNKSVANKQDIKATVDEQAASVAIHDEKNKKLAPSSEQSQQSQQIKQSNNVNVKNEEAEIAADKITTKHNGDVVNSDDDKASVESNAALGKSLNAKNDDSTVLVNDKVATVANSVSSSKDGVESTSQQKAVNAESKINAKQVVENGLASNQTNENNDTNKSITINKTTTVDNSLSNAIAQDKKVAELLSQQATLAETDQQKVTSDVALLDKMLNVDSSNIMPLTNAPLNAFKIPSGASLSSTIHNVEGLTANQIDNLMATQVIDNSQKIKIDQLNTNETIAVFQKDFSVNMKEKVMVMINQKIQQADIQLDPPELGNVQVRVNLQGDTASVSFIVQNSQAKDALEQQMGKLKDMLAESGVDVGEAHVQQQDQKASSEQENGQQSGQSQQQGQEGLMSEEIQISANTVKASAVGVDFYA
jgi:flagellar hook-length control protein FliK